MVEQKKEENPDAWVVRDPRVWRHGKWNAETPITLLETNGYVTPNTLFFIRAHTAVPIKPDANIDQKHTLEICGPYVKKPTTFTLAELKSKFKKSELWSCLVCSGQRRLELNIIKKGSGHIDWHNAAGNAKWGGVYLWQVLKMCGVDEEKARHCEFFGADGYQTSIPFAKCIDRCADTLLAYEMNDEVLHPDHGYPLRIVAPGWSAKCSSKWITKISVQEHETEAVMYHRYYKWFPKYIQSATQVEDMLATPPVTELNTNAVAFQPRNNTIAKKAPLKMSGYCYTGGGRPCNRVEISCDNGKTWRSAKKTREQLTPYGKSYAWVLWELVLEDFDPAVVKELILRAWDCSASGMTEQHEWNLTGMMNNAYFRIKVVNFGSRYVFHHPTTWMNPEEAAKCTGEREPTFQWSGLAHPSMANCLKGDWEHVDGQVLTLQVVPAASNNDNNKGTGVGLKSLEKLYGGQAFTATILDKEGNISGKFGAFFEVLGRIESGKIQWNNGATWSKL